MSNCAAGGTPYKIEIIGVNGRNEAVETVVSNIFFTIQKGTLVILYENVAAHKCVRA